MQETHDSTLYIPVCRSALSVAMWQGPARLHAATSRMGTLCWESWRCGASDAYVPQDEASCQEWVLTYRQSPELQRPVSRTCGGGLWLSGLGLCACNQKVTISSLDRKLWSLFNPWPGPLKPLEILQSICVWTPGFTPNRIYVQSANQASFFFELISHKHTSGSKQVSLTCFAPHWSPCLQCDSAPPPGCIVVWRLLVELPLTTHVLDTAWYARRCVQKPCSHRGARQGRPLETSHSPYQVSSQLQLCNSEPPSQNWVTALKDTAPHSGTHSVSCQIGHAGAICLQSHATECWNSFKIALGFHIYNGSAQPYGATECKGPAMIPFRFPYGQSGRNWPCRNSLKQLTKSRCLSLLVCTLLQQPSLVWGPVL